MYYTPLIYSLDHPLLDLSDFLGLQGCPYSRIFSPLRTESCVHLPPLLDTGSRQVTWKAPPLPYTLHPTLPPLPHCIPSPWMRTETRWPQMRMSMLPGSSPDSSMQGSKPELNKTCLT